MTPKEAFIHEISICMGKDWNPEHEQAISQMYDYVFAKQLKPYIEEIEALKLQVARQNNMIGRIGKEP